MKKLRRFFHLERSDLAILFGLVFLLSGASFTFGVLIGVGMGPKVPHVAKEHSAETRAIASEGHGGESAHKASNTHGVQASAETNEELKSKEELRKEFLKSKEDALKEFVLKDDSRLRDPKSIEDTKAAFAVRETEEAPRNIASVIETPKVEKKEAEKKEIPAKVSTLFERKPGNVKGFEPLPGTFTVQVGSFPTEDLAQQKVVAIQKSGFLDAYYSPIQSKSGEKWYRVAVGSFPSPSWAEKTGQKILRRKLTTDFIVRKVE